MDYFEKRLDGETKYEGVIVNVRLDRAELHNGRIVKREVVEHPGGVTVLPVDADGNCYMVRQFRYPFGKMILEAPAGKLEKGEDPLLSAARELSEETGFTAHGWKFDRKKGRRIDFIYTRGGVQALESEIVKDAPSGIYPSDHYFLWAKVQF